MRINTCVADSRTPSAWPSTCWVRTMSSRTSSCPSRPAPWSCTDRTSTHVRTCNIRPLTTRHCPHVPWSCTDRTSTHVRTCNTRPLTTRHCPHVPWSCTHRTSTHVRTCNIRPLTMRHCPHVPWSCTHRTSTHVRTCNIRPLTTRHCPHVPESFSCSFKRFALVYATKFTGEVTIRYETLF